MSNRDVLDLSFVSIKTIQLDVLCQCVQALVYAKYKAKTSVQESEMNEISLKKSPSWMKNEISDWRGFSIVFVVT